MYDKNESRKRSLAKRSWTLKHFSQKSELFANFLVCGEDVSYNRTTSAMISHFNHVHRIFKYSEQGKSGPDGLMSDSSSEFSDNESYQSDDNEKISWRKKSRIEKHILSYIVKTCQKI